MSDIELIPVQEPAATQAVPVPVIDETALREQFEKDVKSIQETGSAMASTHALNLSMYHDHVELEIHAGLKKKISYESFKEMINRALNTVQAERVIQGTLPPSNMIFMSQSATEMFMNVYHPGGVREMLYTGDGGKKRTVVTPNVIIGFKLKKDGDSDWLVTNALYYCTHLPVNKLPKQWIGAVSQRDGIYDLPMSNTYGGGTMCYGSNSMPSRFRDGNFRGLDWYYKFLWETPFNDDLGVRAIDDRSSVKQWYETLTKHAEKNEPFPYEKLAGYNPAAGSSNTL